MIDTLINWVEAGCVPDGIEAKRIINVKEDRTRPLCPYPQVARYQGEGSIDDGKIFDALQSISKLFILEQSIYLMM